MQGFTPGKNLNNFAESICATYAPEHVLDVM